MNLKNLKNLQENREIKENGAVPKVKFIFSSGINSNDRTNWTAPCETL